MLVNDLTIWSFYCFINIDAPEMLMPKLLLIAKRKSIKGTIILSNEGFNGSICAIYDDAKMLFDKLVELTFAQNTNLKINSSTLNAFSKFKIKLKKEIVTFGVTNLKINHNSTGQYVKPLEWDDFIANSDVVIIDTRNDYEVKAGTFVNSINPGTDNFKNLPKWLVENFDTLKTKKVAMFCTGGIRCEKSTAYLKVLGHNQVYHLEGGILQYFQDTGNKNAKWHGQCFVFDDRRQVSDNLGVVLDE